MIREDVWPIRTGDLPPWDCCNGTHGVHRLWCPHHPENLTDEEDYGPGCDCTELCPMGPTCPGGMLAGLPDSGCWRTVTPAERVQGEAGEVAE